MSKYKSKTKEEKLKEILDKEIDLEKNEEISDKETKNK